MKFLFCDDKRQQVQFAGKMATTLSQITFHAIRKLLFFFFFYFVCCLLSYGHPVASNQESHCSRNSSPLQRAYNAVISSYFLMNITFSN